MPTAHKLIAGLALALTAVSCSQDKNPTAPTDPSAQAPATAVAGRADLLRNLAVTGPTVLDAGGAGPTFNGTLNVTNIARNPDAASPFKLLVTGTLTFVDNAGATVTRTITAPANLTSEGGPTQPTCRILVLDLGPLHLDVLGLTVDLNAIHLNISAQSGPGNLLGNLLCAVAHLLDQNPLAAALQSLLDQINAIIAAL
jgi:hypothetical protein